MKRCPCCRLIVVADIVGLCAVCTTARNAVALALELSATMWNPFDIRSNPVNLHIHPEAEGDNVVRLSSAKPKKPKDNLS